jgi:hypothetical protein
MTDPLFDHAFRRDIARLADAIEGLLAYLVGATPTLAAKPPADFDGAQYAFDAMMGDPLTALGNLTAKPPAADPVDEYDADAELVRMLGGTPKRKPRTWTHWSKLDPRSRELAKLATDAGKREEAAKTPATREAARTEKNGYLNESKTRQNRLRNWLADGKGIIDGDALYYFDADGTKVKFVPGPTPHFFLPY